MARVSDFFFQKNPSLKENCFCFIFEGVKVKEDWLVQVNLFYKESKCKEKKNSFAFFFFFFFFGGEGGGGGGEGGGRRG